MEKKGTTSSSREKFISLGNKFLEKARNFKKFPDFDGNLTRAIRAFKDAGYKKGLIEVGDMAYKCEGSRLDLAENAYVAAGYKEGLIDMGKRILKSKNSEHFKYDWAARLFKAAGYKTGLIEIGDLSAKGGLIGLAEDAYIAAGYKKGLVAIGDKYSKETSLTGIGWAIGAYKKAGFSTGTSEERRKLTALSERIEEIKGAGKLRRRK